MDRSLAHTSLLVRCGVGAFAVGLLGIVITFVGYTAGDTDRPLWQNLVCLLAPLGLAVALTGLVRESRADTRAVRAEFPAVPVALADDPERRRLHARIARAMRVVAVAETVSWLLLIVATVVKLSGGPQLGVQILGPTHGTLFLVYVGMAVITWRALSWSVVTLAVVLAESFLPGGGFLVARRPDLAAAGSGQR